MTRNLAKSFALSLILMSSASYADIIRIDYEGRITNGGLGLDIGDIVTGTLEVNPDFAPADKASEIDGLSLYERSAGQPSDPRFVTGGPGIDAGGLVDSPRNNDLVFIDIRNRNADFGDRLQFLNRQGVTDRLIRQVFLDVYFVGSLLTSTALEQDFSVLNATELASGGSVSNFNILDQAFDGDIFASGTLTSIRFSQQSQAVPEPRHPGPLRSRLGRNRIHSSSWGLRLNNGNSKMRRLRIALVILASALPALSFADIIRIDYEGVVVNSGLGLETGDTETGALFIDIGLAPTDILPSPTRGLYSPLDLGPRFVVGSGTVEDVEGALRNEDFVLIETDSGTPLFNNRLVVVNSQDVAGTRTSVVRQTRIEILFADTVFPNDTLSQDWESLNGSNVVAATAQLFDGSFRGDRDAFVTLSRVRFSRLAQTVPEPGTLALLGLGLAGIVFARRRKT